MRICVCGCVCGPRVCATPAQKTRSASPRRSPRASGRRACLSGRLGVRRRVGHVQLRGCVCVWAWRGGVARRKMRAASVPLRPSGAASCPPATSAGQPTVCVWRTLRGVQLARQGLGAGRGREGSPHATRRGRRWTTASSCACVRRAGGVSAPWSQRDARRRSATASLRTGALPADENQATGLPEPSRRSRRHASRPGLESLGKRVYRAARARPVKKKGGRPKGTDGRGGAPDARPKTHALQKRHAAPPEPAPAGMLQGLPIAAERRDLPHLAARIFFF